MKIKTSELTGKALDWAVGVAVGYDVDVFTTRLQTRLIGQLCSTHWSPTANWGQLGKYTELINWVETAGQVSVNLLDTVDGASKFGNGDADDIATALCRAIVDLYLGDEVDVPEVLV